MDIETLETPQEIAAEEYKKYLEAAKKHPDERFFEDMKKVMYQLKKGNSVVDIPSAIQGAGLDEDDMPKLAIIQADVKRAYCQYDRQDGIVSFSEDTYFGDWRNPTLLRIRDMPTLSNEEALEKGWRTHSWNDKTTTVTSRKERQAIVPAIPPEFRPDANLENYHILWEVDKWEKIKNPPRTSRDPMLLKRINERLFTVLAVWDLTEIERKVLEGLFQ